MRAMPAREMTSGVRRARLQTVQVPAAPTTKPSSSATSAVARCAAGSLAIAGVFVQHGLGVLRASRSVARSCVSSASRTTHLPSRSSSAARRRGRGDQLVRTRSRICSASSSDLA